MGSKHSGLILLWNELGWLSPLKKPSSFKHVLHTLIGPMWEFLGSIFPAKNILQCTADWWYIHQNQLGGQKIKYALLTEAVERCADGCHHNKEKISRSESSDGWRKSQFSELAFAFNASGGTVWNCALHKKSDNYISMWTFTLHSPAKPAYAPAPSQWVIFDLVSKSHDDCSLIHEVSVLTTWAQRRLPGSAPPSPELPIKHL